MGGVEDEDEWLEVAESIRKPVNQVTLSLSHALSLSPPLSLSPSLSLPLSPSLSLSLSLSLSSPFSLSLARGGRR